MRQSLLVLAFFIYAHWANAQSPDPSNYPKGYFRNPLGIPMKLSGNFGELRPNHYHMGLDCKTNARENLPVYAAADGYIARIKIEAAGFGRAIYINHPNGYTTVYAHLNDFNPYLENYVKAQQYKQEAWAVFLELAPGQFPVKKGDFLAYSGNTGGSQAPHLHFEVRQTVDDINLNPLYFGFPIPDNTPPKIIRVALYDRTKSTYEQSPRLFPVKALKSGGFGTTPPVISTQSQQVSLAITAYDTQDGSSNLNGIAAAALWVDGQEMTSFQMNNISYNGTRFLNAHIDYRTKKTGGPFLQHLSELPGYTPSIYNKIKSNGVIDLSDRKVHEVRIVVKDANGNNSSLQTQLRWEGTTSANLGNDLDGPLFHPQMLDGFEASSYEFYIGEKCLYDNVHIKSRELAAAPTAVSPLVQIGSSQVPLQETFLVRLRPNRELSDDEKERTVMQWYDGNKKDVQKVEWQQTWAAARFRDFGNFQLIVDREVPQIVPIGFTDGANLSKAARLVFTVKDNLDKVRNVKALLDGHWLRFTNDKGHSFIYKFDEKCGPGNHLLKISAEDEAGNKVEKTYSFSR